MRSLRFAPRSATNLLDETNWKAEISRNRLMGVSNIQSWLKYSQVFPVDEETLLCRAQWQFTATCSKHLIPGGFDVWTGSIINIHLRISVMPCICQCYAWETYEGVGTVPFIHNICTERRWTVSSHAKCLASGERLPVGQPQSQSWHSVKKICLCPCQTLKPGHLTLLPVN
jgi:hypothetical protein